jgi:hypothetical protein
MTPVKVLLHATLLASTSHSHLLACRCIIPIFCLHMGSSLHEPVTVPSFVLLTKSLVILDWGLSSWPHYIKTLNIQIRSPSELLEIRTSTHISEEGNSAHNRTISQLTKCSICSILLVKAVTGLTQSQKVGHKLTFSNVDWINYIEKDVKEEKYFHFWKI